MTTPQIVCSVRTCNQGAWSQKFPSQSRVTMCTLQCTCACAYICIFRVKTTCMQFWVVKTHEYTNDNKVLFSILQKRALPVTNNIYMYYASDCSRIYIPALSLRMYKREKACIVTILTTCRYLSFSASQKIYILYSSSFHKSVVVTKFHNFLFHMHNDMYYIPH